jgi:hypothetical protein
MPLTLPTESDVKAVFDMNCFKFSNLRDIIIELLRNVTDLQNKVHLIDGKLDRIEIPDVSEIMRMIKGLKDKQL